MSVELDPIERDALLSTHDSHRMALEALERFRYPASSRREARGGMGALAALILAVVAIALVAAPLAVVYVSRH